MTQEATRKTIDHRRQSFYNVSAAVIYKMKDFVMLVAVSNDVQNTIYRY